MPNKTCKSYTQLRTFDTCPLMYEFEYIRKIKTAKTGPLKFGSAFHDFRFRYYVHCADEEVDSDWDAVNAIARQAYTDHSMTRDQLDEFLALCRAFAENRPHNPRMAFEVRFGVNRDKTWASYDDADGFRGIVDGLEIKDDEGVITDAKTSFSMDEEFTQLEMYAAMLSVRYPDVPTWRLVLDFVRRMRTKEKTIIADNLEEIRNLVFRKIHRIESTQKFQATPGEHCYTCPFVSRCEFKMRGGNEPDSGASRAGMIEDYFLAQARARQIKRILKIWVEENGPILTPNAVADFFSKEVKSCDKENLIRKLKELQRNPVNYLEFPAAALEAIRKDDQIADDCANVIFIDHESVFDIKKRREVKEKD